ncbi:MAG: hypothetical protein ACFFBR_01060 [Promethearchaeota archaeon]
MKIVYRHWEPDQGLEDIQAKIYTEASGLPVRAEQIRARNMSRDPKMTRYALKENGDPLAYITSRDSTSEKGRTYIGYPWTMPGAPPDVQAKLFDDLFAFLKKRKETEEIATTVVLSAKIAKQQLAYWQEKGFEEDERLYRYLLDFTVKEIGSWKLGKELTTLTSREATNKDLKYLYEISKLDPTLSGEFQTEEARESYFKDRVLKDGHAVLLFDKEKVIAASAPLKIEPDQLFLIADEPRVIMRFTAIRPGYQYAWKRLVVEIAKEMKTAGWSDIPLRTNFFFSTNAPIAINFAEMRPELQMFEIILKKSFAA